MRDGRRPRRNLQPPDDPDLTHALDAMTADELRLFVRETLDRPEHETRSALVDSLITPAAKGGSGWRPAGPSREIVEEACCLEVAPSVGKRKEVADWVDRLLRKYSRFYAFQQELKNALGASESRHEASDARVPFSSAAARKRR